MEGARRNAAGRRPFMPQALTASAFDVSLGRGSMDPSILPSPLAAKAG